MNINDYEGIFPFKLIIPAFYILSWIGMFFGPFFFDRIYQMICVGLLSYSIVKASIVTISSAIALFKLYSLLTVKKQKSYQRFDDELTDHIYHGIVIPNYNESI